MAHVPQLKTTRNAATFKSKNIRLVSSLYWVDTGDRHDRERVLEWPDNSIWVLRSFSGRFQAVNGILAGSKAVLTLVLSLSILIFFFYLTGGRGSLKWFINDKQAAVTQMNSGIWLFSRFDLYSIIVFDCVQTCFQEALAQAMIREKNGLVLIFQETVYVQQLTVV